MVEKSIPGSGAMEGGGSYNRHAKIPAGGAVFALPHLQTAAKNAFLGPEDHPVVIADYGSSEGKNSLIPVRFVIETFRSRLGPDRPIIVYHTDLPANDFGSLFKLLGTDPDRYSLDDPAVFPCAIGRTFYQSILPPNYVHLGWCSYAAMWISEFPLVSPNHIFVPRMDATARFAFERQAAQDWERFLSLRASELRAKGRLVVVLPAAREDGRSGYEAIMDDAYGVLEDMVCDGAIAANERARMALGVWPRRRTELLAPFERDGRCRSLKVEHCETSELADPAWADYEKDGNKEALAARQAAFYRSVFAPSLGSWLSSSDNLEALQKFSERLEHGLRQRLMMRPAPINSLVETIVISKL
jgi:hypothetical protein